MSRRNRSRAMNAVCDTCGVEHRTAYGHPGCSGHKRKTGAACRAQPVAGTTLCSKHGGMTPAIRKAGAARKAEAAVERTLAQMVAEHYRPDEHPFAALVDLQRRLSARERALAELAGEYRAIGHEENLQATMRLLNDTSRLSAQVSKMTLDANIDERIVQVAEVQVEQLFTAVLRAMRTADLSLAQQAAVRDALADELLGHKTREQREQYARDHWHRLRQRQRQVLDG